MELKAGAGKAQINYTMDMLPTFGENYNAIHDLPWIQVLVLEAGTKIALVSVDIVMMEIKQEMMEKAEELLGISRGNIWMHATHVLATPHFKKWDTAEAWLEDFMHKKHPVSKDEAQVYVERENAMAQAHLEALEEACLMAKESLRPACFGIGTANAKINVNRVVETKDGWWQGVNQDGLTDHSVPVLRFDDKEGHTIALWYNCNVAPGCMEFSEVNGGRMISGDLAGASEKFIDEVYGNSVVSIYTTGATGDQWQALRARLDYLDHEGNQVIEDFHENGFLLVDILATRLGEQVVKTADSIKTSELQRELYVDRYSFSYTGQRVSVSENDGPVRQCEYENCGDVEAEIKILQIEDTAIIACGVEMCMETFLEIKEKSPFAHTFIMEFTTNGGGYMPEEVFYDRMSFQSRKSRYAKGSAEHFKKDILESLHASYRKHRIS